MRRIVPTFNLYRMKRFRAHRNRKGHHFLWQGQIQSEATGHNGKPRLIVSILIRIECSYRRPVRRLLHSREVRMHRRARVMSIFLTLMDMHEWRLKKGQRQGKAGQK